MAEKNRSIAVPSRGAIRVSGRNSGFTQRGGVWVMAQNALTLAALVLAPLLRAERQNLPEIIVGSVLLGFGGWVGIAGVHALGQNRTSYPTPLENSTLVQHGVYRFVRHPLYASLIFASVGWALLWGSCLGLAAAGALTLLLYSKAICEERWLRERHPEYRDYERRVKRFLPGLW
jgi:protein-S-isoprenylcysteine O-methyltransferase Ste14